MISDFLKNLLKGDNAIFETDITREIEVAMAILLSHVIIADGKVSQQESENIKRFYAKEFKLTSTQTYKLFHEVEDNMDEIGESIDTIKTALKNDPASLAEILRHINNLILCDGCVNREYALFETLRVFLAK